MSSVRTNLMLLGVSIIFSLFILEGIVRLFHLAPPVAENIGAYRLIDDPRMVYEMTPGAILDQNRINKQGFMGRDFKYEKGKHTVRIAMLGDSITEGMRIQIGKKFSDVLESILNEEASRQDRQERYEVMNFGVGGYNLGAEVELLKTKVVKYSPDIIVLNFAPNDSEPIPGLHLWFISKNGLSEREKYLILNDYLSHKNSISHFIFRKLLIKSKLYLLVMSRTESLSEIKTNLAFFIRKHFCSVMSESDKTDMRNYLSEIKGPKNKYGFKFLICLHPNLLEDEPSHIPNLMGFRDLSEEIGFPYFNMYGYYKKSIQNPEAIVLINGDYCHPNELGHRIIAEAMFAELKKNQLIDLQ
ncbi:MAG: SGNH/GDSL hydrolase family protein [Candidatus Omnitrophota bacterium]